MACCTGMDSVLNLHNLCCKSVGKLVHWGHCKPKTTSGIDMHDPRALDDAAVVWPHNDNYPLPTDTFRTVLVHGSCCVGLGSSGSTGLHLNLALTINLIPPGNSSINVGGGTAGQLMVDGKTASAIQRKHNYLSRNQCKWMKRTQAKREVFQAQQRSMLSVVNPYLPKGLHSNGPKQPPTAPIEKTLDKK